MAQLAEHPAVRHFNEQRAGSPEPQTPPVLKADWLRRICLDAGADDAGFVERDRAEIADQKSDIDAVFPRTKRLSVLSCV